MARHIQQGYVQDKRGDVIYDATVTIYLAGTTTAVTAYAAVSGGSSVGYVETDSKGYYKYFIDDTEYASDQRFKHVISKTGYTDITEDYLEILPGRLALPVYTLTNDATPSVAGGNIFLTGGTTTITDFDDGVTGQIIYILAEHSVTITDGTNILLADSANYEMVDGNILTLICKADNKWYELARGGQSGGALTIGGTTYGDGLITDDGVLELRPAGSVAIGEDGTGTFGYLQLYAGATAHQGPIIEQRTCDNWDSAIERYIIEVYQDTWKFGPDTNSNSFMYYGGTAKWAFEDCMQHQKKPVVAHVGTIDNITQTEHAGMINVLAEPDGNAEQVLTMPEATGSGAVYYFVVGVVNTSNYVIKTKDAANCGFYGTLNILDVDSNVQTAYAGVAADDIITLNGTTTGGQLGDWVELTDFATDMWSVRGNLVCPAGSNVADPFSST